MTTAAPTRRVDRGRGHVYFLDGEPADGVTWILDQGVPKPALVGWAANVVADYVKEYWEELAEMKRSERDNVLRRVRFQSKDAAARRGTEVHDYAQRLAAGEEVQVPEPLLGHVDSYLAFTREWQVDELQVEAWVGNRTYRYMGTLDLIAGLADGLVWLLDFKTNAKGPYPESALQLAAYRHAEFIIGADRTTEKPMPKVDRCGVVWLRADGYDLVPVEAGADTFRTFLYAQQVAHFTDAPAEAVLGQALTPPERTAAA
jgi:hypothetical protein